MITGDLNVAHREIDIHSPKTNLRSAGFTVEERNSFAACYLDNGFKGAFAWIFSTRADIASHADTFREQHPDAIGYTYFSHRAKVGPCRSFFF